jgi:hypothetical protein
LKIIKLKAIPRLKPWASKVLRKMVTTKKIVWLSFVLKPRKMLH